MKYNNNLEPITMPEYGRHVQNMVNYCMAIEDRDERNKFARRIVRTMRGLVPERQEIPGSENIYWDHLALISHFKLDVDFPEGTITEEKLNQVPVPPPYEKHRIKHRYYGHILEEMIKRVVEMEEGKERSAMEYFIALQMKRAYMTWNRDTVEDSTIFEELAELSQGKVLLSPENCRLIINPNSIDRGGKQKVSKKMLKVK